MTKQWVKNLLSFDFISIECPRIKDSGNTYLRELQDHVTGSWRCQSHNQGCLVRVTTLLLLGIPKHICSSWNK